jgi:type II secretory pathway pseudopilin PulG
MKRLRLHNSSGDTIVEVMIVLAVLSLSFAISYATANTGLNQSRNAEEHSEALGLLNSQVELLRTAVGNQANVFLGTPFCMSNPAAADPVPDSSFHSPENVDSNFPASAASDNFAKYPATCASQGQDKFYNVSITYNTPVATDPSQNYFDLRVRWDGIGSLGRQQEELTYRMSPLTATATSGIVTGASAPQLKVVVKAIEPIDNTKTPPTCSSNTTDPSNYPLQDYTSGKSTVTIQNSDSTTPPPTGTTSTQTDASSTALFTGVLYDGRYTATVTAPAGFTLCNSPITHTSTSAPATVDPSSPSTTTISDIKIIPQCTSHTVTTSTPDYTQPTAWVNGAPISVNVPATSTPESFGGTLVGLASFGPSGSSYDGQYETHFSNGTFPYTGYYQLTGSINAGFGAFYNYSVWTSYTPATSTAAYSYISGYVQVPVAWVPIITTTTTYTCSH